MSVYRRIVSSARIRLRRALNPLLLRTCARDLRLEETLIIAGSNRSGTTWLQEVFAELPGAITNFEPLHVDVIPQARLAGFHKLRFLERDAVCPVGQQYLERVLSGREWHGYTSQFNTLSGCLAPKQLVVKFIHANGLIDWLSQQLPVRRPLVVVRHPAAVNSSVLNKKWDLSELKSTLLKSELVSAAPSLRRYIEQLQTPIEQLTARWCLENAVLFKAARPCRFDLVTYESLVLGGPAALMEIFRRWDLEPPASVAAAFTRDSFMTAGNRSYASSQQRLAKWQAELSPAQIAMILRITQDFGLDFYSEAVVPNEQRFTSCRADGLLNEAFAKRRAG